MGTQQARDVVVTRDLGHHGDSGTPNVQYAERHCSVRPRDLLRVHHERIQRPDF
jgi:hypothetical protein